MREPDDRTAVRHMTEAARKIVRFAAGRKREDLDSDEQLCLSLVRLLEIIGEAATRVSAGAREANTRVPWSQMIGMRNRLIHGYDVVDLDVLWRTVTGDIPDLMARLDAFRFPTAPRKAPDAKRSES
jgi:uncharacterized protein with HEPN domain